MFSSERGIESKVVCLLVPTEQINGSFLFSKNNGLLFAPLQNVLVN